MGLKCECQSLTKKETAEKKKVCRLVSYEELPEYMKENEYIRRYYRAEWPISNALLSLFSIHNETLNIWTHLIGFFVFLGLTLVHLSYHLPKVADFLGKFSWSVLMVSSSENISCNLGWLLSEEAASIMEIPSFVSNQTLLSFAPLPPTIVQWPFFVYLAGSMFCLLSSTTCHLLSCHSRNLNIILLRLDYAGIATMIVTSFFPPIYYIFHCTPHWQFTYLTAITALGFSTVFTLFSPHLSTGKFRSFRAMLFSGMAFFGVVPAIHAAILNWDDLWRTWIVFYEAGMAISYVLGTLFYVTRVPERWRPGWFDVAGHSHQIFHVLVMAGALAHYGAALVFLKWRTEVAC